MIDQRILEHAKKIRAAIEHAGYFGSLCSGACALASIELFKFARKHKIKLQFVGHRSWHCFNLYKGTIYDITYTQFSERFGEIAIVPMKEAKKECWWEIEFKAKNLKELAELERNTIYFHRDWSYQNPYLYKFVKDRNRLVLRKK